MSSSVVDTPGAAAHTGFSESTLEKMRCRGDGPPYLKISKKVLYRVADLDAWLGAHVVTSTSQKAA